MCARRLLHLVLTLVFWLLGAATTLEAQGTMTFSTQDNQIVTNPVFHYDVYVCSYGIVQTQWGEHQHDYGTASVEIGGTSASNCNWDEYQVGWSGNLALIPGVNNFTSVR